MPCNNSRTQQEEARVLFFPGKNRLSENPWTLFTTALPPSFSAL